MSAVDEPGAADGDELYARARRWRGWLLLLAGLRYAIPIGAIPLAPVLIPDSVWLLNLLRPGKEVVLLAGGLTRTTGQPGVLLTFLTFLPLMVGGVWAFFGVGRAYADDLRAGKGPNWLNQAVPPDKLLLAQRVLVRRGPIVAFIGRVAALPPTIVAAAAGTSDVSMRGFLVADFLGAVVSFAMIFGIGLGLGELYEQGGPWLTGIGAATVFVGFFVASYWLRAEAARQ